MCPFPVALVATLAAAQTFDARGPSSPPDGASVRDPLTTTGGRIPGAPALGIVGEAASQLLVRELQDGTALVIDPVVGSLFGTGIDLSAGLSPRIGLGLTLPIWFASDGSAGGGVALGDASIWAPISIATLGESVRFVAVPFVRLPTGADDRYLGDPGFGGGALVGAALDRGLLATSLDLGLEAGPGTGLPDWPGGLAGRWAGSVGLVPSEKVGIHVEWRGRTPLRSVPSVPSEVIGSLKVRPDERIWLDVGAGTALTRGVGAAGFRMFVGAHAALGTKEVEQAAPVAAAPSEIHVIDERRWPLRGAVVTVGRTTATTDHEGYADLPPKTGRLGRIDVNHPGFEPAVLEGLTEDQDHWEVVLRRVPVPVAVSVVGPTGALEAVDVTVTGPGEAGEPVVDEAGVVNYALRPGTWTVSMSSPGLGVQQRTIEIAESRSEPIRVDAVLAPIESPGTSLKVEVVDRYGQPVEDAVVALEERDLGTTGTGGDLTVEGVSQGEHAIVVRSARLAEATIVKVQVVEGAQTVRAVLEWPPGSVLVRVRGPDGQPTDARIAFLGPVRLPSRSLGSDGEELFVLRPGTWDVLVSSETLGTQERRIEVDDRAGEVVELDFVLQAFEGGEADLQLLVADLDGVPLPGVEVSLDGLPVGRTGPDGDLVLQALGTGVRFVEVEGELLVPLQTEIDLVPGRQIHQVTPWWVPGVVNVEVRDVEEHPIDALVAFAGAESVPPIHTGGDGRERVVLPAGAWDLAISSEEFGTSIRPIQVLEGGRRAVRVDVRMLPIEDDVGSLSLTVTDPESRPVRNARVTVDDLDVGELTDGRLTLQGLPKGPVDVVVEAEALQTARRTIDLSLESAVSIPMPWAPGALEIAVQGPTGPIDAMLLVAGPAPVPPREAESGVARFGLTPGRWFVLASHPDFAAREQVVELPTSPGLTRVAVQLEPVNDRGASLLIAVRDPDGHPVSGVDVWIDGASVGRTTEGGSIALRELPPGRMDVELRPTGRLGATTLALDLDRGADEQHTVVLPFLERPVAVKVVGADGAPVEAAIEAMGPAESLTKSDTAGNAELALAPGAWRITARTADGIASAELLVSPGQEQVVVPLALASVETTVSGDKVVLARPLLFPLDSDELSVEARAVISDVARRLKADRSAALIEVQGHTDDQGGVTYNQQLSERRAAAVKAALVADGVAPERLVARGYGLSRPVTSRTDEESRQLNRRVELVVLQQSTD